MIQIHPFMLWLVRYFRRRKTKVFLVILLVALITASIPISRFIYYEHDNIWQDLNAYPMSRYKWSLEIDAQKLIREFKNGNLTVQPITVDRFSISRHPEEQRCKDKTLITVLIKTRVEDRYNRDVLRRTWIEDLQKANLQHSFLLGLCNTSKCYDDLLSELIDHQDIIQGNFIDAYRNNTLKFRLGLKYITYHCNKTAYVLLIDGDYSLNVKRLLAYLAELGYPKNLYAGQLWPDTRPSRDLKLAQYMSYEFYPFRRLPPFIAAGASLISTELVEPMNIIAQFTKFVPYDDVFYGMVAKKLNIPLVDASLQLPSWFIPAATINQTNAHKSIIGSHRFGNVAEVEIIHGLIHS